MTRSRQIFVTKDTLLVMAKSFKRMPTGINLHKFSWVSDRYRASFADYNPIYVY